TLDDVVSKKMGVGIGRISPVFIVDRHVRPGAISGYKRAVYIVATVNRAIRHLSGEGDIGIDGKIGGRLMGEVKPSRRPDVVGHDDLSFMKCMRARNIKLGFLIPP